MKVVAVYSTKGGVGKTTAAVNLAWEASKDFRVLLWDLDPQGAATYLLNVKPKVKGGVGSLVSGDNKVARAIRSTAITHLDVLPADASYRELDLVLDHAKKSEKRIAKLLDGVASDYDVVILDCPPGASLVAENAVYCADAVVLPLVPSALVMRSLEQVTAIVAESDAKPTLLAFLSMVDRRKAQHRAAVEALAASGEVMTDVVIPATVVIERMGDHRAPVAAYAPTTEAASAYGRLWARVQGTIRAKRRGSKR